MSTKSISRLPAGLQVRNQQLVQNNEFIEFVQAQKALQQQVDDGWAMIQKIMEAKKIKTIKGDWGHITLAERTTLNTEGELPPRFYKKVLDPAKVKAHKTIHGSFPIGVVEKVTTYLSKRITV